MWPTEPAKADWSFNKWQITKKRRRNQLPLHLPSSRHRKGRAWAEAPVVAAVRADAVAVAEVDVVVPEAAQDEAVAPADKVADKAVGRGAKAVSAAGEAVKAKAAIAMADAEMVAASSSRT